jgi:hypothetical protein
MVGEANGIAVQGSLAAEPLRTPAQEFPPRTRKRLFALPAVLAGEGFFDSADASLRDASPPLG